MVSYRLWTPTLERMFFYEEVKAFCSRALLSLFSQENNFYQEFPALASWLQSDQFLHGKSATCFCNGIGGNKQGHLSEQSMTPMQWINSHNFAGLPTRSIMSMNPNQHLTNTIPISDLLQLFSMLKHAQAISLVFKCRLRFMDLLVSVSQLFSH